MEDNPQKKKQNPDVARMKAAIVKAETNRLYGEKERAELQERQTPSSFYMGRGESGYSIVKTKKGLQELETVGNIQPSMGMPGRGGFSFDPGAVSREDNRRSYSKILPLKIVVSWNIDGQTKFYIGGHVKTPILALDIPTPSIILNTTLTSTGRGKNDWILQVRTGSNSAPMHYTRYGATPEKNWDRVGGEPLLPMGGGFWFAQAFPGGIPPDYTRDYDGLYVGEWTPIDGEYDDDTSDWILDGPGVDTGLTLDTWTGWPSGSRFFGTNISTYRIDETLDNGSRPYLYLDPFYGYLRYSQAYYERIETKTRTISTQAYTFWAFENSFQSITGGYSYNAQTVWRITSGREENTAGNETDDRTTQGTESFSISYPLGPNFFKTYSSSGSFAMTSGPPGSGSEVAQELSLKQYFYGNSIFIQTNLSVPWTGLTGLEGGLGVVASGGFNYSSNRKVNDFGQVAPQYVTQRFLWRSPDGTEREIQTDSIFDLPRSSAIDPNSDEGRNPQAIGNTINFYLTKLDPATTSTSVIFGTAKVPFEVEIIKGAETTPIEFSRSKQKFQTYPIPKPATATAQRVWEWKYFA